VQPGLGDPASAGGLDWVTHRGPFQPRPFCDSVKYAKQEPRIKGAHTVSGGGIFVSRRQRHTGVPPFPPPPRPLTFLKQDFDPLPLAGDAAQRHLHLHQLVRHLQRHRGRGRACQTPPGPGRGGRAAPAGYPSRQRRPRSLRPPSPPRYLARPGGPVADALLQLLQPPLQPPQLRRPRRHLEPRPEVSAAPLPARPRPLPWRRVARGRRCRGDEARRGGKGRWRLAGSGAGGAKALWEAGKGRPQPVNGGFALRREACGPPAALGSWWPLRSDVVSRRRGAGVRGEISMQRCAGRADAGPLKSSRLPRPVPRASACPASPLRYRPAQATLAEKRDANERGEPAAGTRDRSDPPTGRGELLAAAPTAENMPEAFRTAEGTKLGSLQSVPRGPVVPV